MNMKLPTHGTSSAHDDRVDAALKHFAGATPAPGLESRVTARLAAAGRARSGSSYRSVRSGGNIGLLLLRRLSIGAMAAAAAIVIVFGTVEHSRRIYPVALRTPQTGGVSPANSVHYPTHPMPQSAEIHPGSTRNAPHSRAVISPNHTRHASGAAVPRSPYPPESQPASSSSDPQQ